MDWAGQGSFKPMKINLFINYIIKTVHKGLISVYTAGIQSEHLMLNVLGKIFSRQRFNFFSPQKTGFDISCKFSLLSRIASKSVILMST